MGGPRVLPWHSQENENFPKNIFLQFLKNFPETATRGFCAEFYALSSKNSANFCRFFFSGANFFFEIRDFFLKGVHGRRATLSFSFTVLAHFSADETES